MASLILIKPAPSSNKSNRLNKIIRIGEIIGRRRHRTRKKSDKTKDQETKEEKNKINTEKRSICLNGLLKIAHKIIV